MKHLLITSVFLVLISAFPRFGKADTLVCTYATGAEIVIDLKKEKTFEVNVIRTSPQKYVTQKIYIKNTKIPSEINDYVEIESKGHKITYNLKCEHI